MNPELLHLLQCPRCSSAIGVRPGPKDASFSCTNSACDFGRNGFPVLDGKPALIDFDDSIMTRESIAASADEQAIETKPGLKERLRGYLMGGNDVAGRNCQIFLDNLKKISPLPRVLVIGGGTRGAGTDVIYDDPDVEMVGTDIYLSKNIALLADGHHLPFKDGVFDGVIIQAVLEHVLDPPQVVAEIRRVLKPDGLVYAETPFMQQVHMGAFDFTRFTASGHRWLFRQFDEIEAGTIGGAGMSLFWSIRYFVRSLLRSDKLATAVSMPFFWLRYLDRWAGGRHASDGANGVYFIGRRAAVALRPRQMVAYYQGPVRAAAVETLETAWPSATTTKSSASNGTQPSRTSSQHSAASPRSATRTATPVMRPRSSASKSSTRLMRR
jgi:SAM-dependent methyltransferase